MSATFFGKYRGKVEENVDPLQLGRLQVSVPAVLGAGRRSWAMPSVPYAGPGVGFFALPPRGANVWIDFEGGSPDRPIWSGCFWGPGEVPAKPAADGIKMLKTDDITLKLWDLPGASSLTIETKAGMKIQISAEGIEISNGQGASITLTGPKVTVNNGALEVT